MALQLLECPIRSFRGGWKGPAGAGSRRCSRTHSDVVFLFAGLRQDAQIGLHTHCHNVHCPHLLLRQGWRLGQCTGHFPAHGEADNLALPSQKFAKWRKILQLLCICSQRKIYRTGFWSTRSTKMSRIWRSKDVVLTSAVPAYRRAFSLRMAL